MPFSSSPSDVVALSKAALDAICYPKEGKESSPYTYAFRPKEKETKTESKHHPMSPTSKALSRPDMSLKPDFWNTETENDFFPHRHTDLLQLECMEHQESLLKRHLFSMVSKLWRMLFF
jgi:hypothetical protein